MSGDGGGFLFTAFEPSGDALAAPVIAELRRRAPDAPIWALGGSKMAAAGAELIESTTDDAVMFSSAAGHWRVHRAWRARLREFMRGRTLRAHVPVDSPAANWGICAIVRREHSTAPIVHLVAPQIWAWGGWRIGRLRRLTDHVLCILPFEPDWFAQRGVEATFVGHPLFAKAHAAATAPSNEPLELPQTHPRLALLPGSRANENHRNWPMMHEVFERLRVRHAGLNGAIALGDEKAAARIRAMAPPADTPMIVGRTDDVIDWADVVLVVSGTATLQCAARGRTMVAIFNASRFMWNLLGRWIIHARTFALPNVLSEAAGGGRIVPEFAPHFGKVEPVFEAVDRLLANDAGRAQQTEALVRVTAPFRDHDFSTESVDCLLETTRRED